MSYFEDRPIESWFNDIAESAAEAYRQDPIQALALTQSDIEALIADHRLEQAEAASGKTFKGLGQAEQGGVPDPITAIVDMFVIPIQEFLLPAIFSTIYGKQKRRAKKAIKHQVKYGVFRAGEALGNAVIHQMMAVAEQGELLARYRNLYGVVKGSTDPNAKCPPI